MRGTKVEEWLRGMNNFLLNQYLQVYWLVFSLYRISFDGIDFWPGDMDDNRGHNFIVYTRFDPWSLWRGSNAGSKLMEWSGEDDVVGTTSRWTGTRLGRLWTLRWLPDLRILALEVVANTPRDRSSNLALFHDDTRLLRPTFSVGFLPAEHIEGNTHSYKHQSHDYHDGKHVSVHLCSNMSWFFWRLEIQWQFQREKK